MYRLTTTEELRHASTETIKEYVARAMQLSKLYDKWKMQDEGGYTYTVDVTASKGRAAGVHASEISQCDRKLVYACIGIERKESSKNLNMQRRFNLGHAVHAMIQAELYRMCAWINQAQPQGSGITFEDEVSISPKLQQLSAEWDLYSSCDGVFTYWYQDQPYLRVGLEIKTESGPQYEKLTTPRDYHLEQCTLYMAALSLPLMWTLYVNKSNSNYTPSEPPWLFRYNHDLWTKIIEPRIAKAQGLAYHGVVPERTEGFYCKWCPFSWECRPPNIDKTRYYGPAKASVVPRVLRT